MAIEKITIPSNQTKRIIMLKDYGEYKKGEEFEVDENQYNESIRLGIAKGLNEPKELIADSIIKKESNELPIIKIIKKGVPYDTHNNYKLGEIIQVNDSIANELINNADAEISNNEELEKYEVEKFVDRTIDRNDIIEREEEETKKKKEEAERLDIFVENKENIAETFYKNQPFFYDEIGLFWWWNNDTYSYELKDELDLMNSLKKIANQYNFQITRNTFWTETIRALKLIGRSHKPKEWNKNWIQFNNIIYDINTGDTFKPSPEYFNVNPVPHNLGESEDTPIIDSLFKEWVGEEYVLTLKETIALTLIQDYPLHRLIILFGSGLNGKGVFLRFVEKLIGEKNIVSSSIEKIIKDKFASAKLYKKNCCLIGETNFGVFEDTKKIKELTGQDLIDGEFKNKNAFNFRNYATIFIASNSLPSTLDKTDGFYRRPLIIDFPNKFPEGKTPLLKITETEYSNLCKQLIGILKNLLSKGEFNKDGSIEERKKRYEEKSNPVMKYLKENYVEDVNGQIPFFEFYDGVSSYIEERGLRTLSKNQVTKLLKNDGYDKERKDVKRNDNSWTKWDYIIGISTRSTSSTSHIGSFPYTEDKGKPHVERVEDVESIDKTILVSKTMILDYFKSNKNITINESDLKKVCNNEENMYKWLEELKTKGEIFLVKPFEWKLLE